MKKITKSLRLSIETVRQLSEAQLGQAAGGTRLVNPVDPITETIRNTEYTCLACLKA